MQSFLSLTYIFPIAHCSLKGAVTINEEITKNLVQNNLLPHSKTVPSALNSEPVALRTHSERNTYCGSCALCRALPENFYKAVDLGALYYNNDHFLPYVHNESEFLLNRLNNL